MKKNIIALIGAMASLCGCGNPNIKTVDADQFESLLLRHKIQLVDVRTPEEFANGFIPSAINIDVKQDGFSEKAEQILSKDKPVGVYCRSGKRSLVGANMLVKSQFKVVNLKGGIIEWMEKGKRIQK